MDELNKSNKIDETNLWNFAYWAEFSDMVYSRTLNAADFVSKGAVQHQDTLFEIDDTGKSAFYQFMNIHDHFFYKLTKGNTNYLLSKRFVEDLPMVPTECRDLKLKPSDSNVWKFVEEFDSFVLPETKIHDSLASYLQQFNPVKHSNPPAWTILKCVAIAKGLKIAICGTYKIGKNANYHIKSAIQNNAISGMKNKTEAMFYKLCLFNDDLNLDEITTWTPKKIQEIEDKLAVYGDQSTSDSKHALDSNKKNETIKNINNKSFIITFNPYDEDKHPKRFGDNMGNPGKIKDRFPFIYLQGEVLDAPQSPVNGTEAQVVSDNVGFFRKQAGEFMYWRNNYYKHMHGYDRTELCFYNDVRKMRNISPLIDVIDAMSISKEVFDYWIDFLNKSNADYIAIDSNVRVTEPEAVQAFNEYVGAK